MRITDVLRQETYSLSFEVFPPKDSTTYDSVEAATQEIAMLKPSFVSVTYGAGGGTSQYTLNIARNIKEKTGVSSLAHLTCVSSNKDTVHQRITELKEAGITNIMALRGDLTPQMQEEGLVSQDYHHAVDLIRELKESGADFCIGGACYPEVHPESKDQKTDIRYLKEKVDAGCDFLTTQMFFDNNLFYTFLYKIREAGITVPIMPGIMPITNAKQIDRAIKLSGSFMPVRFKSLVDRFGTSSRAMKQAGIIYATDQIIDLFANGIQNVHIYTMNKPDVARAIMNNVSQILGRKI